MTSLTGSPPSPLAVLAVGLGRWGGLRPGQPAGSVSQEGEEVPAESAQVAFDAVSSPIEGEDRYMGELTASSICESFATMPGFILSTLVMASPSSN